MGLPKQTPRVKAGERFLNAPGRSVPELLGPLELRDGNLGDSNPEYTQASFQGLPGDSNLGTVAMFTPMHTPHQQSQQSEGTQSQEPTHGGFLIDMSQWGSHIEFYLPRSYFCSTGFGYDLMHKNMLLSLCYANYGAFLGGTGDKGK